MTISLRPLLIKVLMCFWVVFVVTSAQSASAQAYADISIRTVPKFPRPGDTVTVELVSSDVNLDFQNIDWYINGAKRRSGSAETSLIFTMEKSVPRYEVRAVIGSQNSQIVRTVVISPGDVILLWEAVDSFQPPWYMGKPLLPVEGLVRITAIPIGSKSLDNLFFVWKQNGSSIGTQSGYGKNSIVVRNSVLLDTISVELQVSSSDGTYQAENGIQIPVSDPDIRIWSQSFGSTARYENNGVLTVRGEEANIQVLPFNMSTRDGLRGVGYEWTLNDLSYTHSDSEPSDTISIARTATPVSVGVTIQSIDNITQSAQVTKQVRFE